MWHWSEQQYADYMAKHGYVAAEQPRPDVSQPPFKLPADDAPPPVTVSLPGDPQGKGRARAFRRGDYIGMYTPEKTRTYESAIRAKAAEEMADRVPFDQPVSLTLRAVFAVPASWSKNKRAQALTGAILPAKKPDMDNIIKAWSDAMNGVVFRDDCLIVDGHYAKVYGPAPLVVCTVRAA